MKVNFDSKKSKGKVSDLKGFENYDTYKRK